MNMVFYTNEERGWTPHILSEQKANTYDIISDDLNDDRFPDIIVSNSDEVNLVYLNFLQSN